jgi:hypothetical protein
VIDSSSGAGAGAGRPTFGTGFGCGFEGFRRIIGSTSGFTGGRGGAPPCPLAEPAKTTSAAAKSPGMKIVLFRTI